MAVKVFDHSNIANLDYGFQWSPWLAPDETIVTSNWVVTPAGVDLSSSQISDGVTSVFAAGGTVGTTYLVTNTIITSSVPPRTDARTLSLLCKKR